MITDLITVLRKELKHLPITFTFQARGFESSNVPVLAAVLIFGVVIPVLLPRPLLRGGAPFSILHSPFWIAYFLPAWLVTSFIPDSFAGERERHTLERLLATPLSEAGILLGKVAAAVFYATVVVLTMLAVSTGIVLLRGVPVSGGAIRLLGLAICVAFAFSAAGALISLGAKTVRQAQLATNFTIALPWLALLVAGAGGGRIFGIIFGFVGTSLNLIVPSLVALGIGFLCLLGARFLFVRHKMFQR